MSGGTAPKRAGDAFERDVVRFLVGHGHPYAERAYGAGRQDDRGDIDGLPGFAIQCRAEKRMDVSGALDAAVRQARPGDVPVAVLKRRQHSTGRAYAVTELATLAALVEEARRMRQYELVRAHGRIGAVELDAYLVLARSLGDADVYDVVNNFPGTRAGLLHARTYVEDTVARQAELDADEP